MLPRDALRQALRAKGYGEQRRTSEQNLSFTLMTDGFHVLILQEYADGSADVYAPLVPNHNDLLATIDAIPQRSQ